MSTRRSNRKRRTETSKKILHWSWAAAIILSALVARGTFKGIDVSNLTTVACLSWAEVAAAHGFYYWKAKNENRAKGTQRLIKELAETYGVDAAARFAELIYKD